MITNEHERGENSMRMRELAITMSCAMALLGSVPPLAWAAALATNPVPSCVDAVPVVSITAEGGGQSPAVDATMTVTFVGNILTPTGGNSILAVCKGTNIEYTVNSTVGTPVCKLDGIPMASSGFIGVDTNKQRFVCTNTPEGADNDSFLIKAISGP